MRHWCDSTFGTLTMWFENQVYVPWLHLSGRGLRVTQHAYFWIMTHTKQLLLVTFCQPTAGIGVSFRTDARRTDGRTAAEGQTDVEVEIVI